MTNIVKIENFGDFLRVFFLKNAQSICEYLRVFVSICGIREYLRNRNCICVVYEKLFLDSRPRNGITYRKIQKKNTIH